MPLYKGQNHPISVFDMTHHEKSRLKTLQHDSMNAKHCTLTILLVIWLSVLYNHDVFIPLF